MRVEVTGQEVRDIVRREVVNALDVRNVSKTPQPVQQTIHSLIQGRLNDRFQAALFSNDLNLVVFTLPPAHSPWSLIQQLSVDLGEKTEVKHAFLHEALVNLYT